MEDENVSLEDYYKQKTTLRITRETNHSLKFLKIHTNQSFDELLANIALFFKNNSEVSIAFRNFQEEREHKPRTKVDNYHLYLETYNHEKGCWESKHHPKCVCMNKNQITKGKHYPEKEWKKIKKRGETDEKKR